MAHSLPVNGIGTRGDLVRLALAGTAFVRCCAGDLRVQESYTAWCTARAVGPLVAHLRRVPQDVDAVHALGEAMGAAADPANRQWGARLVGDDLRLSYAWLGPLLIVQFALWTIAAAGRPAEDVAIQVRQLGALPADRSRLPQLRAAQITRAAQWFYRLDVKQPADPVHELTAEYAQASGRRTPAHSVIRNNITQVKVLLDLIVLV